MLGAQSIVWSSAPSLTIVTVNPSEVFPLVAELGTIGANPWAEKARRAREITLVNIVLKCFEVDGGEAAGRYKLLRNNCVNNRGEEVP